MSIEEICRSFYLLIFSSSLIFLVAHRTGWNIEPKAIVAPDSADRPIPPWDVRHSAVVCAFPLSCFISCMGDHRQTVPRCSLWKWCASSSLLNLLSIGDRRLAA